VKHVSFDGDARRVTTPAIPVEDLAAAVREDGSGRVAVNRTKRAASTPFVIEKQEGAPSMGNASAPAEIRNDFPHKLHAM
jgi:hypothetical protein